MGQRAPYGPGAAWPVRVDTFLDDGVTPEQVDRWVPSACVLCSNGCGLDIAVAGGRMVGVRGRVNDRVNHGRLGPKGLFGGGARLALAGGWRMELEFDIGSVPSASPTSRSAASPIIRLADAGAADVPPGWRAYGAGEESS